MELFRTPTILFYERMSNLFRHQTIAFMNKEVADSAATMDPYEFCLIMRLAQASGVSEEEFVIECNVSHSHVRQLTLGSGLRPHPKQHDIVIWLQARLQHVSKVQIAMS